MSQSLAVGADINYSFNTDRHFAPTKRRKEALLYECVPVCHCDQGWTIVRAVRQTDDVFHSFNSQAPPPMWMDGHESCN